jgi:hypothetical protein
MSSSRGPQLLEATAEVLVKGVESGISSHIYIRARDPSEKKKGTRQLKTGQRAAAGSLIIMNKQPLETVIQTGCSSANGPTRLPRLHPEVQNYNQRILDY